MRSSRRFLPGRFARPLCMLIALSASVSAAGCGGSGTSGNSEASKSPQTIVADAARALLDVHSFELNATVVMPGQRTSATVAYEAPSAMRFELASPRGGAVSAILIGEAVYINADKTFYDRQGANGAAAAALVAGRWIKLPSTTADSGLSLLTQFEPSTLSHCMATHHGTLSDGGTATVRGRPAVIVVEAGDKPGTIPRRLYVAAHGPALPLRIVTTGPRRPGGVPDPACGGGTGSGSADATFTSYNRRLRITPPAGAISIPGA